MNQKTWLLLTVPSHYSITGQPHKLSKLLLPHLQNWGRCDNRFNSLLQLKKKKSPMEGREGTQSLEENENTSILKGEQVLGKSLNSVISGHSASQFVITDDYCIWGSGMCKSYHVSLQFTKYFHRNFKVDSHEPEFSTPLSNNTFKLFKTDQQTIL